MSIFMLNFYGNKALKNWSNSGKSMILSCKGGTSVLKLNITEDGTGGMHRDAFIVYRGFGSKKPSNKNGCRWKQ